MRGILLMVCVTLLISCSDGVDEQSATGDSIGAKSFTVTWDVPSSFEDNSPLDFSNLSQYRIYYGDSMDNIENNVESISGQNMSFSSDILDQKIIASYSVVYLAMTSISSDGIESVLSETISFSP